MAVARTKTQGKLLDKVIGTTWYRGQPRGFLETKWRRLFFTSNRGGALTYAKNRRGEIVRARIIPQAIDEKVFFGSLPDLAKALGLEKQYYKLELEDKFRESEALVEGEAIKRGLKLQIIDSEQVAVFSPEVIDIKKVTPFKPRITTSAIIEKPTRLSSSKSPKITPKIPKLR